uniref:Uncharacterized protein n=2 Tax=Rhizophora mucronata TaxID=61149 RepID=A0A2P2MV91_RHIMU
MALPREPEEDYDEEEIYKKVESKKGRSAKLRVHLLIEWVAALGIFGCFIASLTVKELRKIAMWDLQFWKWCLLLNVIFCGMLVTNWLLHIVVFLNRRNFMQRMKYLPFVHRLQRSLQVKVYRGWKALSFTLNDTRRAVAQLFLLVTPWRTYLKLLYLYLLSIHLMLVIAALLMAFL